MLTIEVLHFPGCPNAGPAIASVHEIVGELESPATVVDTVVDPDDVERLRFLGSPTVRVNGVDVEPAAGERSQFGYSCRTYETPSGVAGTPPETWIRAAIQSTLDAP